MEIEQNVWGFTDQGEAVILYTMTAGDGSNVKLTNYGASIVGICTPDREGNLEDVVLGYSRWDDYRNDGTSMGRIIGRYAGRIAGGRFTLAGEEFHLPRNNMTDHLHGGPTGFGSKLWESRVETNRVVFSLFSPDGDQGYPGNLWVEIIYDWDEARNLEITLLARGDSKTIVNLTSHSYFNLDGGRSTDILDQELKLYSSRYLITNKGLIPTGEIAPVGGTPMDFTVAKRIGKDIGADFPAVSISGGYDSCWVIDDNDCGEIKPAARLYSAASGRTLEVFTDQPGIQVYSANDMAGLPMSKNGKKYGPHAGIVFQCQGFPDAPNHEGFPLQVLDEGEIYCRHIIYRFGTES